MTLLPPLCDDSIDKAQLSNNLLKYYMKSEELFEIDRQINQIRRDLEQRQQKVAEWDVPLTRILKDRSNKDFYLSKKYTQSNLHHYLNEEINPHQAKVLLKQHNEHSRSRVQLFKNDLRQLQELLKKRNVFRLTKANRLSCKVNSREEEGSSIKKDFSKTNYEPSYEQAHRRNEHDHSSLSALKGQKLLQVYQQGKLRGGGSEQALGYLKRFLGLGLENTPFYGWAQRNKLAERTIHKTKPKLVQSENKHPKYRLQQYLKREVQEKKDIYLSVGNDKKIEFQQRLKRIMRYNKQSMDELGQQWL